MLRLEPYTQVATSSDGRWQFEVRFLGAERDFLSCYKLFDCRLGKRAYLQDSSSKLGLPDQAFVHPSGDAVVWFNGLCCNYAVSLDLLGTERLVVGVSSEAHSKRRVDHWIIDRQSLQALGAGFSWSLTPWYYLCGAESRFFCAVSDSGLRLVLDLARHQYLPHPSPEQESFLRDYEEKAGLETVRHALDILSADDIRFPTAALVRLVLAAEKNKSGLTGQLLEALLNLNRREHPGEEGHSRIAPGYAVALHLWRPIASLALRRLGSYSGLGLPSYTFRPLEGSSAVPVLEMPARDLAFCQIPSGTDSDAVLQRVGAPDLIDGEPTVWEYFTGFGNELEVSRIHWTPDGTVAHTTKDPLDFLDYGRRLTGLNWALREDRPCAD